MAERSKARAWKVRIRQKRIVGSNPTLSAKGLGFARLQVGHSPTVHKRAHKGIAAKLGTAVRRDLKSLNAQWDTIEKLGRLAWVLRGIRDER